MESLQGLDNWCASWAGELKAGTLIFLKGEVGVGKTYFVKSMCKALGVSEGEIQSPSFSLLNFYQIDSSIKSHKEQYSSINQKNRPLEICHGDLYRLEDERDIESTGFWDIFENKNQIIFLEWPERVPHNDWPLDWRKIEIDITFSNKSNESLCQREFCSETQTPLSLHQKRGSSSQTIRRQYQVYLA